jgi:hypothetical protein
MFISMLCLTLNLFAVSLGFSSEERQIGIRSYEVESNGNYRLVCRGVAVWVASITALVVGRANTPSTTPSMLWAPAIAAGTRFYSYGLPQASSFSSLNHRPRGAPRSM